MKSVIHHKNNDIMKISGREHFCQHKKVISVEVLSDFFYKANSRAIPILYMCFNLLL